MYLRREEKVQLEQPRHSRFEEDRLTVEIETRRTAEAQRERSAVRRQSKIARARSGTCCEGQHDEEGRADAPASAMGAGGSDDAVASAVAV